ncbi:MAG TPA: hypothetical protein VFH47_01575 [Candidatus Thermoplasmatota archaeon]|nr:hypothetical protein [Candidatus Thermoplasmatota archaeon]
MSASLGGLPRDGPAHGAAGGGRPTPAAAAAGGAIESRTRPLRILVPVTGAFDGRPRVRRSQGTLDTEGLDRVLSQPSAQAIALALQLKGTGAHLTAVHVDKGEGENVLREAMAHGLDQGILIEGAASGESDAMARAHTIADVYRQTGPYDAVIGPRRSEFAGFTGSVAGVAGLLGLPVVVGVRTVAPDGDGWSIQYESMFGTYDLRIPRPVVIVAGDLPPSHPTTWGIHDAFARKGILRVRADQFAAQKPSTRRVRVEAVVEEKRTVEEVDAATLVRRMRSRNLLPARAPPPKPAPAGAADEQAKVAAVVPQPRKGGRA